MAKEKMESFKIGDSHRQGMNAPAQKAGSAQQEAESASRSLGFTRIEELLENEDLDRVGDRLARILASLEEYQSGVSTQREKTAAQKAIAAVERTVDLMDFLYQTKSELEEETS